MGVTMASEVTVKAEVTNPIIFTNGCFDGGLHAGHRLLLRACAEIAERFSGTLVVALNDDASVRRLKGNIRPVHMIETRMESVKEFLSTFRPAIRFNVVRFSADNPESLIRMISPHVLVKGSDAERPLAGEEFVTSQGGCIVILERLPGISTTELLARGEGVK